MTSCCGPDDKCDTQANSTTTELPTRDDVREYYGKAGETPQPALCCATIYKKEDIAHIPQEVMDISYGCGSPVMIAEPKVGEVYVDLGSGGGVDCFIASKLVGKTGRVIGVDMTPEMMMRATTNAGKVAKNLGYHNVEFRHGHLEEIPVDADSVDLVTSNCVVNLSPDKKKVFTEIGRVLKDGGRFVISDIVSEVAVPLAMQKDKNLWGECISGALTEKDFLDLSTEAGFYGLQILKRDFYKKVEGYNFWSVTLQAWKMKKSAAGVYVGQWATYLGPFSQVSDDENHTYLRNIPFEISTDTARRLSQAPYRDYFRITDPTKSENESQSCCTPESENKGTGCC